jgi:hypothetical protein
MKYTSVTITQEDLQRLHYIKYRNSRPTSQTLSELIKREEERLRKEEK